MSLSSKAIDASSSIEAFTWVTRYKRIGSLIRGWVNRVFIRVLEGVLHH